jgi:carbon monoxide dehydrogenase subunit G
MLISFKDKTEIKTGPAELISFLSDAERIARCIPDSKGFARIDDTSFSIIVNLGVGIVRGDFKMEGKVNTISEDRLSYSLSGKGLGSEIRIRLDLAVEGSGNASVLSWSADAELKGVISGVGEGILRGVAKEKIGGIVSNIRGSVEK